MKFMGGSTALHAACIEGHLDVLEALIGAGANLNAKRRAYPASDERTALHEACKEGHTACALRLVQAGAAMHLKDAFGLTPCALAEQKGHHTLANKLRKSGAP
jgi:ankyrin repeat protein